MNEPANIPVFILCGGLGTRIKEETEFRPKPMVPIGEQPILWHVMQIYARHGFRRFVLCLGFKAEVVKDYFTNFHLRNADSTINLKTNQVTVHEHRHKLDWEVTLAFTGEKNQTGSRIVLAARKYLGSAKHFAVTYGDGLTDANLAEEFRYHLAQKKMGTVLGVNPPSRFGEIKITGDRVVEFAEKPDLEGHWINGGYFFFETAAGRYSKISPGWHSSVSQIASSVEKRMALALPVLRMDRFCGVMSTASARSFRRILRCARTTSRLTMMGINLNRQFLFLLNLPAFVHDAGNHNQEKSYNNPRRR